MTTEKSVVSYTPEQTAEMVEAYVAVPSKATVEAIATKLGKTVKSVIAKLSREKVYVPATAAKSTRVTKAALISAIAVKFGATPEALESLEKASKDALEILAGVR